MEGDNVSFERPASGELGLPEGVELLLYSREALAAMVLNLRKSNQLITEENEQLREEVRRKDEKLEEGRYDGLLKTLLRRECIVAELEARIEQGSPFIILYIDLDNFKNVNDSYGHPAGDEVLRLIELLLQSLRKRLRRSSDNIERISIGRMGGDELLLVITDVITGGERSEDLTEQVKNMTEWIRGIEPELHKKDERARGIGFSIGAVAFDPENPVSVEELLKRADKAMYTDKQRRKGAEKTFTN